VQVAIHIDRLAIEAEADFSAPHIVTGHSIHTISKNHRIRG